jgi:hypothetical protein
MFGLLERSDESIADVLARTAGLVDHGPVVCGACGAQRTVGRRAGDNGAFVCLSGCGSVTR